MKNIFKISFLSLFTLAIFSSCEDIITVDTGFDTPQIVVDAWIDNQSREQTIVITQTQDYFNSALPTGLTDADVTVTKGTQVYNFIHTENGKYVWSSTTGDSLGVVGDEFVLNISLSDKTYQSTAAIHRVPPVDSIALIYEEESPIFKEGFYGEAYAVDFPGVGDTYWMKAIKNDTLLNRPLELNPIYDGTFEAGSGFDGATFITPKRRAITPLDEDGRLIPFVSGDKIEVELHSINNEAFNFLTVAFQQITNSQNTIFALPIANTKGNIRDLDTGERIIGVFNVAAISYKQRIVD